MHSRRTAASPEPPASHGAGAEPGEYGASLRRLRGMPVRTVRPGHGPSFGLRLMHTIIDRHLASRATAGGTS